MKKILILFVLLIIVAFPACVATRNISPEDHSTSASTNIPEIAVNEAGPIEAISNVTEKDGIVYFTDNESVKEVKGDTVLSGVEVGSSGIPYNLYAYKDYFIYITEAQPDTVFAQKSGGKSIEAVKNLQTEIGNKSGSDELYSLPYRFNVVVANDRIFYTNTKGYLCRAKLDGSETVCLLSEPVERLQYYDGWIYYIDGDKQVCRIGINGGGETVLTKGEVVFSYCICEEGLFFTNSTEQFDNIYRNNDKNVIQFGEKMEHCYIYGYEHGNLLFEGNSKLKLYNIADNSFTDIDWAIDAHQYEPKIIGGFVYYYKDLNFPNAESDVRLIRSSIDGKTKHVLGGVYRAEEQFI